MTWLSKALNFLKKFVPEDKRREIELTEEALKEGQHLAKLTMTMTNAARINIEEGLGKAFRAVTGTGGLSAFDSQEGPLQSTVSIQDLVAMSKGVYEEEGGSREGYTKVANRTVKDLAFTVFQNDEDGHVVVAFRGTNSFENWQKRNLDFHRTDDGHGNIVHGGFKAAWDDLKPAVDHELFEIFGGNAMTNNVTFTGHSLGGAIAQLATADYTGVQNPRLIDGVTFASPVVGDDGFNARIPGGHLMNVFDPRDSVPKIVQQLQPDFKENTIAKREMSLGDRAARINDEVKKDAIRFGIEVSFDAVVALILAYNPEVDEGLAEAGPEADAAIIEEVALLEEELVVAGEEAAGFGEAAEEASALKSVGAEGEGITNAQRADISLLMNASSREEVIAQLRQIDVRAVVENAVKDAAGKIDVEKTVNAILVAHGIDKGVRTLLTPFIQENVEGLEEVDPDKISFLIQNSWDFMYGSAVAHPVDTYVKNVHTRFGDHPANARDMMWKNFLAHAEQEKLDISTKMEFLTEEELKEFQESFAHEGDDFPVRRGRMPIDPVDLRRQPQSPDDLGAGRIRDDDDPNSKSQDVTSHVSSGKINGRPLQVLQENQGRKSNGERIFAVVTEDGQVLSYTGPSHPASSTTLYGKWTGVAPFADAEPMKVNRQNAFGGRAFSALDTFSLAYLVNSYTNGYHNQEADKTYQKRIHAAIENGFISEAIDGNELRVAKMILHQFEEKGHLFGASDFAARNGNMLTEIEMLSRGKLSNVGDDVNGIPVGLSRRSKRKIEEVLKTPEGTALASDIMKRDSKRLKSSEVDDVNIREEGSDTIHFNLKALQVLGLDKRPEFSVMLHGAKQNALAYKTALNVEEKISRAINETQSTRHGVFAPGPNSIFPNTFATYTSSDVLVENDKNKGGNEEYIVDMAVSEILKSII